MRATLPILFLALTLPWNAAQAHDLWLEEADAALILRYGHLHSGHEGQAFLDYPPTWIQRVACFDISGQVEEIELPAESPLRLSGDCAVSYVLLSSGFWTKTPRGTRNLPPAEVDQALASWLSLEGIKHIAAWSEELSRPLSTDLELVPIVDPFSLHVGDKLRLLVTLAGEPVEGAIVTYDGKPRGRSGAEGRINLKIRHGGLQMIQASLRRPLESGQADETAHACTLNFELEMR